MENERKTPAMQFEQQEEDAKPEEDGRMDADEETENCKTLEVGTPCVRASSGGSNDDILLRKPTYSGSHKPEIRKRVKKGSPERSHRARWIFALDTEGTLRKVRCGRHSILIAEIPASISKKFIAPHRSGTNGIAGRGIRREGFCLSVFLLFGTVL